MKNIPFCIALFVVISGCVAPTASVRETSSLSPFDRLRSELAVKFDDPEFYNAHWGVLIQSLKTREVLYQRNENKSFMPASNMKLFTSAAALSSLSPDFRYTTTVWANGTVAKGVLNGDLIVKGSGDPTISGRYNGGMVTQTFEQWADSIKAAGINEINGDLVGDNSCFDDEYYGEGWEATYETDWYAAQISGLSFNDNCVDMKVVPADSAGEKALITWTPQTRYITVVNETQTIPPDSNYGITFQRERGSNRITVRGTLPINKPEWKESIAIDNPTLYTMTVLKEVLETKGIRVRGKVMATEIQAQKPDYAHAKFMASYASPLLSEIVKTIDKPSQNFYAEQVFRTMGTMYYRQGSMATGRYVANPIYAGWGIDTTRLMMLDGSGLSRMDLVSPKNIVTLLNGMYEGKYFQPFYESLPIAGVDGSLKDRMKGTKAEKNVHAKTGYIGYVRSLSGYVTSLDGEMFVFSMLANHYTVPTRLAERIQNDVCIMLANFSRTETKNNN